MRKTKAPEWFKDFENRLVSLEQEKSKAPEWFVEFEKKNDARWDSQAEFNKEVLKRLDVIEDKLERNNIK